MGNSQTEHIGDVRVTTEEHSTIFGNTKYTVLAVNEETGETACKTSASKSWAVDAAVQQVK
jgi:hypothetical protein